MSESGLRVLVCGGRTYRIRDAVWKYLDNLRAEKGIAVVIHGAAPGADSLARSWAWVNNVPELPFEPDWDAFGNAAGPIRNRRMVDEGKPDLVVAFPGRRGTADMIRQALKAGIPVERPYG